MATPTSGAPVIESVTVPSTAVPVCAGSAEAISRSSSARTPSSLRQVEDLFHSAAGVLDLFLEHHERVDQLLRTGRAAGHVDVDRDHLIHWDQRVVVEDAGGRGAGAH